MQTRKLSVKTVYDLTLAESLRVSVVVHTLTEITEPKSFYLSLTRRSVSSTTVP
jgi:hypothetical protein